MENMMITECARRLVTGVGVVVVLLSSVLIPLIGWAEAPDYNVIISAPDRSNADRQADRRRDPLPFLAFTGVRAGMKVLDMGAAVATALN